MNGSGISNGERCSRSNSFGLGTGTGSSGTGSCASIIADQASINNNCVGGGSFYDQEAEDDMVATERELAEDAQWKRIQQNTFTRWANEHLKTVSKNIGNLETDLSDGLRLITLIEVLSGERLPKHNKKPTFRSQKLENVSVALKFLEDVPIKIVNIDSTDIVDCKLKLILGLIWTLILHYSISMPIWEGENDIDQKTDKGPTPKQRLLNWIQSKLPDLPITNFTTDWNDGKAVGALVDAVAPGLCPDWQDWKSQNALQNAKEAMDLADDWLDVKQLITPEELVSPKMDEQSMMTYLSQYPNAKLKQGAPLRPRTNANRVRAYGPGIEPKGPPVRAPAKFTVETFSAGNGEVDVKVENPKGQLEPVDIRYNNDRSKTYTVTYTPKLEGKHKVSVFFAGKEIPKSPYGVSVEGTAGDATKVTASGPGLQPDGVMVNRSTYFDIFTKDAGRGTPEVIIVDTAGQQNALSMKLHPTSPGVWRCEYIPPAVGLLNVNIFFENQVVPNSPFTVRVQPVSDATKVKVSGRGVQPVGIRVNDAALFHINAEKAGEGKPEVQIIGPGGVNEPAVIKRLENGLYDVTYYPKRQGRHIVMVTFAGQEVPRSPFEVNVGPYKETQIQAYGPGLVGGIVGYPAQFTVESNGETGALGFSIEGTSQAKIECDDNGDGSANIRYYPTAPGEYAVHILCDNEDIPNSPYIAQILPSTDYYPDKVECSGKGIGKGSLPLNVPADFTVDTRKAGNAPLDIKILDVNCKPVPVNVKDNRNGTFTSQYTPKTGKKHTIQVNYGGVAVPGSPFQVFVAQPLRPEKVQIFGPGVESGVKPNRPTHFTADCRDAGPGKIDLKLKSDNGAEVPLEITDNEDGTYLIDYAVPAPGDYNLTCRYEGVQVPQSPLKIKVPANVDVSKIKVDGLETMAPINSLQQFHVMTEGAGKADFTLVIRSPSGNMVKAHIVPTHDGYLINFTPTELGEYWLNISFGGQPVLSMPHKLTCTYGSDPTKVTAFGPGLERGVVKHPAEFVIDTKRAGRGGLGVTVEGPCEAAINCRDNGDGTCSVAYLPMEAGEYIINVTFNDQPIPGSPYQASIVPDVNWRKIRAIGNGIQLHGVCLHTKADILVDSRDLGIRDDGKKVTCTITNPSGIKTENVITPLSDGTYKISYTPFEEGPHTIEILYDGLPIPGSPFVVNVKKGTDPTKCKAYGPGLEKGILNQPNKFTVETKGAGSGGLGLAIEGPSEAKMTCKDNRDGSCSVEYVAFEPGEYDVSIKFADQQIPGSPFKVNVEPDIDVKKIKVYGPGIDHCRAQIPASFKIDASAVGKAPLDVSLQTDRGPLETKPEVYDNGDGTYDVVYVAGAEGSTLTTKILYNGVHIPNSPFKFKVRPSSEPDRVKVIGPVATNKGGVFASIPTEFTVDTSQAGVGNLDVQVTGPDSQPRKVRVIDNGDGQYKVHFTPDDCGLYTIPVKFNGQNVPLSPLHIQAYATGNADECKLPPIHDEVLTSNEEHKLIVDAKKAGYGNVTCRIKSITGIDADVRVVDNDDGTFTIYYKLQEPGEYTLNVKFGGQPVPGGLCAFTVKEEFRSISLDNIPLPTTGGHVTDFLKKITVSEFDREEKPIVFNSDHSLKINGTEVAPDEQYEQDNRTLYYVYTRKAEVKMPSGKVDKPVIEDNRDGTVSLKYEPREEGLHELLVKYNGEHVQGSPFKFHVDSISSGYVTAYGAGLTHGVSGEPANFSISTKGAGAGGLSLAVEGPSKAEISCHDNKDGTVAVSYLPTAPGEYKITVKFGDKHIKGSPYNAKVTGEGRKRNQISVGSCSEVSFPGKVTDADTRLLNASIQAPSGLDEPCFLKKLPSGNLGISFTPREIGEHVVSVKRMGKHIANSPFKIKVGEREVGDAKKVKVTGAALEQGKTQVENFFNVDTRNAGYGGLSLSIEGPSKAEIQCKDNEDGTLKISYKPTEPGYYIVNLKFADHHVEGSPFTVKVTGEGSNRQREKIEKHREAVPITEVGSQCKLTFKMPGITTLDLMASVASPAGVHEDAEIHEVEDGLYAVHFVPKELGVHTVSVKYKDIHIPGSPFQFTVGPLRDGGAHRVHAGGPGLERGEQGQPCEFNVWTREAGAGSLAISVEGPSKAEIDFKDRKDGSCYVSYVVSEPGEYRVGIKFNDQHIPDSPYKLFISPALGDAHKLEVAQFPDGAVQADTPSHFLVHKNGAKGELDGRIISPSGAEDDCFIQSIDADTFSVRFMPRENGIHNIHIKFNGVHIPGSPFRIKVGKDDADPAAVHAQGNGLGEVKTGHKTDFLVDTCNAGTGTLAVTIDGPSKVSMDCTEVEEGYKVRYTPLVPGDYYISLKYNGYHIAGSPFKVKCIGENLAEIGAQETSSVVVETVHKTSKAKVTGPQLPHFKSDASKVTCKGLGLKKAYLQKQNQFNVQASDAGNNILFVGLYGPKGPCEEVYIKHIGRNNYNVNYLCRERGEYIIYVKWGDEHVPGSPFRIEV